MQPHLKLQDEVLAWGVLDRVFFLNFPFYFLRVLAGRLWIFISVTTFVFNFGQVFLCSKFEPIGFLFLIFTYCLSVWAVNANKSNKRVLAMFDLSHFVEK